MGAVISIPDVLSVLDVLESICHGGLWSLARLSAWDSGSLVTCHFQHRIQSSRFSLETLNLCHTCQYWFWHSGGGRGGGVCFWYWLPFIHVCVGVSVHLVDVGQETADVAVGIYFELCAWTWCDLNSLVNSACMLEESSSFSRSCCCNEKKTWRFYIWRSFWAKREIFMCMSSSQWKEEGMDGWVKARAQTNQSERKQSVCAQAVWVAMERSRSHDAAKVGRPGPGLPAPTQIIS